MPVFKSFLNRKQTSSAFSCEIRKIDQIIIRLPPVRCFRKIVQSGNLAISYTCWIRCCLTYFLTQKWNDIFNVYDRSKYSTLRYWFLNLHMQNTWWDWVGHCTLVPMQTSISHVFVGDSPQTERTWDALSVLFLHLLVWRCPIWDFVKETTSTSELLLNRLYCKFDY